MSGNPSVVFGPSGEMFNEAPNEILMHELVGHAIPNIVGRDSGNAVDNENRVGAENGMKLRPRDPAHVE